AALRSAEPHLLPSRASTPTVTYSLSLHDALPIWSAARRGPAGARLPRTSTSWPGRGCRSRGNAGRCRCGRPCTARYCRRGCRSGRRTSSASAGPVRSVRSFRFLLEQCVELVLVGVVAQEVVELGAGLQGVDDVLLRAFAAHGLVEVQGRLVHRPVGAAAVQGDVHAGIAQFVGGEERGGAELGEV